MPRSPKREIVARSGRRPPFIGALLRMTYRAARQRQFQAQIERGFTDLNQAHLNMLIYPPPDGARLTDIAERTYMTKQAVNYLLGQLEDLGYIERRAPNGRGRRLVYLTRRGWEVYEAQWESMQQLEAEWSAIVGRKKFEDFVDVLRQLSSLNAQTNFRSDITQSTAAPTDPRPRRKPPATRRS
jgi:DNA-binding MarR family transcriptional regulator